MQQSINTNLLMINKQTYLERKIYEFLSSMGVKNEMLINLNETIFGYSEILFDLFKYEIYPHTITDEILFFYAIYLHKQLIKYIVICDYNLVNHDKNASVPASEGKPSEVSKIKILKTMDDFDNSDSSDSSSSSSSSSSSTGFDSNDNTPVILDESSIDFSIVEKMYGTIIESYNKSNTQYTNICVESLINKICSHKMCTMDIKKRILGKTLEQGNIKKDKIYYLLCSLGENCSDIKTYSKKYHELTGSNEFINKYLTNQEAIDFYRSIVENPDMDKLHSPKIIAETFRYLSSRTYDEESARYAVQYFEYYFKYTDNQNDYDNFYDRFCYLIKKDYINLIYCFASLFSKYLKKSKKSRTHEIAIIEKLVINLAEQEEKTKKLNEEVAKLKPASNSSSFDYPSQNNETLLN